MMDLFCSWPWEVKNHNILQRKCYIICRFIRVSLIVWYLTHRQTLKDRATQLLRSRHGALVMQCVTIKAIWYSNHTLLRGAISVPAVDRTASPGAGAPQPPRHTWTTGARPPRPTFTTGTSWPADGARPPRLTWTAGSSWPPEPAQPSRRSCWLPRSWTTNQSLVLPSRLSICQTLKN